MRKTSRASCPTPGVATLLWLTSLCLSCAETKPTAGFLDLNRVAVSQAPLSRSANVVLADENTACVIDSYQVRVLCTGRDNVVVGVVGREGAGPGEFLVPLDIVSGADGTVGVIDAELQRLSVFRPTGELVSDARLPGVFRPAAPMNATLIGTAFDIRVEDGAMVLRNAQTEVDIASGEILWQRVFPDTQARDDAGCEPALFGGLLNAAASPTGRMAFSICDAQLLFFSDREAGTGTLVRSPTYTAELPSSRDLEEYEEARREFNRRIGGSVDSATAAASRETFRSRPMFYSAHTWFDARDRLWVLTRRDRDEWSYLDIFAADGGYAGTVRVRDRALGFDILGQTLAVLVERQVGADDADGIPDREVDWYDVSRLDMGLGRP
jgi:hypothetical protein